MQISSLSRRGVLALSAAVALALAGCGDKSAPAAGAAAKAELTPVGIVQLVEHAALDACTKGVVDALAERGFKDGVNIKLDIQNAQGDQSNLHNIANRFVSNKDKVIFAVATPAAQAVATVAKNTPIVATAITDFVAAKLVKSDDAPGGNVTGVSDLGPIEAQLDLLLKFIPNAKVVGTIYNSSEINSAYQVEIFLSVTLQIFAHDVDFGVKSNSVLHCRVGAEEFIQHLIVFVVAFGMQVELQYSTRRMIFFHVLPESDFSVLLLVRTDNSFMYFTENDDFFFISGEQHQHPCSKISALT